jgi:hypothetical protein
LNATKADTASVSVAFFLRQALASALTDWGGMSVFERLETLAF